ncbi:MAG: GH3 auxin-responsive promoter family protein, partial [Bacteroidetes bacterium]|nr:GH3 auxin-responsive promoter family protein [Bacteroidota bacterium]
MGIKASLSLPFAKFIVSKNKTWKNNAVKVQQKTLLKLLNQAQNTVFGKDHSFSIIQNYADFKNHIPVRDYEGLKPYIDQIIDGKENILWPGKPLYFSKTSGTTSGTKYIPISKESMPNHITAARDAILSYIAETKNTAIVDGKMIFLQGSPELSKTGDILTGRLSGIVAHHIPSYLTKNRLPSFETNCIVDWEVKVDAIVDETISEKMSVISGIPPWVQMYFEKLQNKSGLQIKDLFPKFDLFIYGGV